ncbi:heme-binding domain-containing protein [Chitinophaga sp.]|uniref:heme-binding domain-containing protein n=1 Tax=Chitinophaga sp. TaxID=1869181 RepID=UPI0031E27833
MKKIIVALLVILVLMQFYQPAPNKDNGQVGDNDFVKMYNMPLKIGEILKISCYDCHSNNTHYLWYDYIQPGRMLVERHIAAAKKELNFSEWGTYSSRKQQRLLSDIKNQVKKGEMPLRSYTLLHTQAKLKDDQVKVIVSWIEQQQ